LSLVNNYYLFFICLDVFRVLAFPDLLLAMSLA
jgi:hypothetical protein